MKKTFLVLEEKSLFALQNNANGEGNTHSEICAIVEKGIIYTGPKALIDNDVHINLVPISHPIVVQLK